MSAMRQRGAVRTVPSSRPDDTLLKVANWLREPRRSGVTTREAVQYERRVEYFKGIKMVEALLSPKYKDCKGAPQVSSKADAIALCGRLMGAQYFHRSQRVFISARRWELEMHPTHQFEEDGLYTWLHEGSQGRLYLLCGLTLAGALILCMVQIWPIWMKIGLWWCSVTFLTTFSALCAVRLALFLVMFAVGFRGIWLFPNLFDDNQTFAGSFLPIMGRAEPVSTADEYESDDDELRRIRTKKKGADAPADGGADGEGAAEGAGAGARAGGAKKRRPPTEDDPAWKFGLMNAAILGVIGLIACWNMGFFEGDNVPDFVAKHDDLNYYFKTLAAPEPPPNGTEGGGGGAGAAGGDEHDPFAAPADEDVKY